MRPLTAALLCALAVGCRTVTTTAQPIAVTAEARSGQPVRTWRVIAGEDDLIGLLVRFEGANDEAAHTMVRNIWHQDLGLIDARGRAYRYVPHSPEPAWVGSGTVLQGVERILGRTECRLLEVPFELARPPRAPGESQERRAAQPRP